MNIKDKKVKQKYQEILRRKEAKKMILQNFLDVNKETRRIMVAAVQKDNDEKTAYVKNAVKRIYELNGVGGPLRIVLDDLNLEDHQITWCLDNLNTYWSDSLNDEENAELRKISQKCAEYLLEMSYSKRYKMLYTKRKETIK
jgi:hypothetical protein